ncbi:MAG: circadian clock KaiB family protein [Aulosira sp. ZfuVER01]|nr:circadian clock KaiB family protein [Aulosira sp. ZfuVER01]MDZ8001907.1 circadian clock KaiB family protein [Aulosira sp. DedVER01a]MDZ8055313.1 circadian clock KaiB family protein [Aulosira sp. ZfuCHP01]
MNNSQQTNDSSEELIIGSTEDFEKALANIELEKYVLRLYVAGNSIKSMRAIQILKNICEQYLEGRYEIEIIDIYQKPETVEKEHIFAIPTLIKELPPPLQRLIGDLTNLDKVIVALDIV